MEAELPDGAALEDFARLAVGLSGASAARLLLNGEVASAVTAETGEETAFPLSEGRLVLYGATRTDGIAPLLRRIEAHAAHAASLALAERANDIARSAARRFESLFEGLPVACYACDAEGRLMEWNRAAEEIWGATIANAWGEEVAPVVDPDHPEAERAVLARALAGEFVRSEEREVRVGDGESRWHLVSAFPLRDGAENVVGAMGARLDITRRRLAQRELAEREARFRTVLETLREGLTVIDETGTVVLRNPSADRILGVSPPSDDMAIDFPARSVLGGDGYPLAFEEWPINVALRTGRPTRDFVLGIARPGTGERVWISVNAEPLLRPGSDAPIGAVATFTELPVKP